MAEIITKSKPMFEEERAYLSEKLGFELPSDCWTYGGSTRYIWRDLYQKDWYVKFSVDSYGNFTLLGKKEKNDLFGYETFEGTIERERERLLAYWEFAKTRMKGFMCEHPERQYGVNTSGGKDSIVVYELMHEVVKELPFEPKVRYHFSNSTNEAFEVYRYIKSLPDVEILSPEIGWHRWLKEGNYFTPTRLHRACCAKYKEGSSAKIYGRDADVTLVLGMRNLESRKRAKYEWFMDWEFGTKLFGRNNQPKSYNKVCPIVEMSNSDVWLMMLLKGFHINEKYKRGFQRVGCMFCPFSTDYEDVLNDKYYPLASERWRRTLAESFRVSRTVKANCDEEFNEYQRDYYLHGGWKMGGFAESVLVRAMTEETASDVSKKLGLSEEMLWKYHKAMNTPCPKCGKLVGFMAVSMFYKLNGRYEGMEDNREIPCKACQIKEYGWDRTKWREQVFKFQDEGCNLF